KNIKENITLFVNISPASLSSSDFVKYLISVIEKAKKENINIVVELTEQSLLENYELLEFLKKEYDFSFAIDDFGAGYSSIKVVQDLSILGIIDYLKIDGMLIKDIVLSNERKKLVELIVNFAQFHGLKTIGEFVENKETAEALRDIGIDYGQGYYFGKPKTLEELIKEKVFNK
ncbi:MAG: EAL domain-containing protein, partial [Aquificae bacterium]|nr:EAL domain-containing protein [Aquificota bacterium]